MGRPNCLFVLDASFLQKIYQHSTWANRGQMLRLLIHGSNVGKDWIKLTGLSCCSRHYLFQSMSATDGFRLCVSKYDNCSLLVVAFNVAKAAIQVLCSKHIRLATAEECGRMYSTATTIQLNPRGRRLGCNQTHRASWSSASESVSSVWCFRHTVQLLLPPALAMLLNNS